MPGAQELCNGHTYPSSLFEDSAGLVTKWEHSQSQYPKDSLHLVSTLIKGAYASSQ